ncbi:MAG: zf-HC2 domain-containing protein [Planctomycetes bacterium]|nr:zf-HC2 domain-containing protein [Planctomycetota bacterium]
MSCPLDRDKLTGYFDGELDAADRNEIDRHIASCSECLRELEEIKSASFAVRGLPRLPVPGKVTAAIRAGVSGRVIPMRKPWLTWGLAGAAALFLVVNVAFFSSLRREESRPPENTDLASRPAGEKPLDAPMTRGKRGAGDEPPSAERRTAMKKDAQEDYAGTGSKKSPEPARKPGFYTVVTSEVADARERVEQELARMGVRHRTGAGEYDSGAYAQDTCIEVELTDEQLAELENAMKKDPRQFVWVEGQQNYYPCRQEENARDGDRFAGRMRGDGSGKGREDESKRKADKSEGKTAKESEEPKPRTTPEDPAKSAAEKKDAPEQARKAGPRTRRIVIYFHELQRAQRTGK